MSLRVTVEPALEPVTLQELKAHLRVDGNDEDDIIKSWGVAARKLCESITNRRFITTSVRLTLDSFEAQNTKHRGHHHGHSCAGRYGEIVIPESPLQSITSISYVDTDGATQTLASSVYQVDTYAEPGRVKLAYNQVWPQTRCEVYNAVTVIAVIGYGLTPDTVPQGIKAAIKMLAAHWYTNREPVLTSGSVPQELSLTIETLLWQHRVVEFA